MLFGQCPNGGGDKLKGASRIQYTKMVCILTSLQRVKISTNQKEEQPVLRFGKFESMPQAYSLKAF